MWETEDIGRKRIDFSLGMHWTSDACGGKHRRWFVSWGSEFCRLQRQLYLTFNWWYNTLKYMCSSWDSELRGLGYKNPLRKLTEKKIYRMGWTTLA